MTHTAVRSLFDVERYPAHEENHASLQDIVAPIRHELATEGCARVPGFLDADRLARISGEVAVLEHLAYHSPHRYNTAYGHGAEEGFEEGHPRRVLHRLSCGVVTRDRIPDEGTIVSLYRNPALKRFLATCLGLPVVHESADPLRSIILNVMPDGGAFGWHYDAAEITVTLLTKAPEEGGVFEYCPGIRTPGNDNYEAVAAAFEGRYPGLKRLHLQPGDLHLFMGRHTLHRVTDVIGSRHTVVFGYDSLPGFVGRPESAQRFYGRIAQEHLDAERARYAAR
ncbi:MAG: hypothetical protein IIZ92_14940 [Aquincola sp.]|nr:hypothetical protein [Aquincola sp.]